MNREPVKKLQLVLNESTYELDPSQLKRLNDWLPAVIARIDQKFRDRGMGAMVEHQAQRGEVYAGASGGNFTISVTPTTIGTVFKVSDSVTGETLDLTDYDNW